MARLDKVKNITGLVELFAKNSRLRELVNLVVVAGNIDQSKSKDREEISEIEKMHNLMNVSSDGSVHRLTRFGMENCIDTLQILMVRLFNQHCMRALD
jgi:sucrose synthase